MLLKIPFYKNKGDGRQCMQVVMQSVIKYFLNKDYSLNKLDEITDREKGLWSSTSQMAKSLHELGLKIRYYSKINLKLFLKGEPFMRKHFGKDANKILRLSNLPIMKRAIRKTIEYKLFTKKKLSFKKIEDHIKLGHIPLMLIDINKINNKKGGYTGHFVVVTGFNNKYIFYHESGPTAPKANKKVLKITFIKAWNANGTDNDVVIVFGKK